MAYFKNLIAETVLEVEDDQVDTYLEYSDRYALCDINGNVIAEAEVAEAPKATKKNTAKEEKVPETEVAEVAEAPKAEAVVEER
nr:MAG TPA: hypothetical protein [Caudoviricetes sp.]